MRPNKLQAYHVRVALNRGRVEAVEVTRPLAFHDNVQTEADIQVLDKTVRCWVPARPCSAPSFFERLCLAYAVFTGKADALFWNGQE